MENSTLNENVVDLPAGSVKGQVADGVLRFRDIPYAAAPVGPLRFQPPRPVERRAGVRRSPTPKASAPQRVGSVPGIDVEALVGSGWVQGDDYLTLDLWRPADDAAALPVMVWIHGGGFLTGSKDAPVHDGTSFARDGVVCVAINYRLGVDGFLPIEGVPTNLGLRDMIAALEWVAVNASAFGGDPDNVTVFGESAGAMAIADLMTSPLAAGLFRRAIVQSGHGAMTRDVATARRLVERLAADLDIAATRDGFAGVPTERLLDAVAAVSLPTAGLDLRGSDGREPVFGISRFVPVHGDDVLPVEPLAALRAGKGAEVDLLIGTNADEMNLYVVPGGVLETATRDMALAALAPHHPAAAEVLRAYGLDTDRPAGAVLAAALSDLVFRWPARRFAEEHRGRSHVYEFDWGSTAFGGRLGAAHAVEVPFVFDTLACATGPEGLLGMDAPQALADRVHRIWVGCARDGTLPWPEFTRERRHVHQLAADTTIEEAPMPAAAFLP